MPESRDRLSRPEDLPAIDLRNRQNIGRFQIYSDERQRTVNLTGSQFRQAAARRGPIGVGSLRFNGAGRGSFGTPRSGSGRGRNLYGSSSIRSRENISPAGTGRRGRGHTTNSLLPSWYPRTPLRDITAVVRAIERQRARLREAEEGQQIETPIPHDQNVVDSAVPSSGAHLEPDISMITPSPAVRVKPSQQFDISMTAGKSESLTPQKELLGSIEMVQKKFIEDLSKLNRTPTAKKAVREKKVRTLKSMR